MVQLVVRFVIIIIIIIIIIITTLLGETGAGRQVFQFLIFNKLCGRNIIKTGSIFDRAYIWQQLRYLNVFLTPSMLVNQPHDRGGLTYSMGVGWLYVGTIN